MYISFLFVDIPQAESNIWVCEASLKTCLWLRPKKGPSRRPKVLLECPWDNYH